MLQALQRLLNKIVSGFIGIANTNSYKLCTTSSAKINHNFILSGLRKPDHITLTSQSIREGKIVIHNPTQEKP
ncbi:hypothetical protein AXX17_AT4G02030 [Arabidopsis thaliana]|uniref:Uncharacterized protein n=1 Tax=Arabidopsis thaliana TaxID=3702 RepID=A0A178V1Z8_ARATH|nr:hypothetical protein AXX17_AT4G02030 [Arabidopsis thaliana]